MGELNPKVKSWLAKLLGTDFSVQRPTHSHEDEVYRVKTSHKTCYLKISATLRAERDNLAKLKTLVKVPAVVDFYTTGGKDHLLIEELPGKDLVELAADRPAADIVAKFAEAARKFHSTDARQLFPGEAKPGDALLHGDMSLPNIIISDHSQIGYIDLGRLSYGKPDKDLADAIWSLQRNIGPGHGELFLREYGTVAMTDKLREALRFKYDPS
jgi:aminoglycoside phosphotransferase